MKFLNIFIGIIITYNLTNASIPVNEENILKKNNVIYILIKDNFFFYQSKESLSKLLNSKKNPASINRNLIKKYYKNHNYIPFWVDSDGIKQLTFELLLSIKEDSILGPFSKKLFNLDKINLQIEKINSFNNVDELITLDIMLTSIYHQYMRYLSKGFINWGEFQKELKELDEKKEIIANWKKYDVRKNIRRLLYKAVKKNNLLVAIKEVDYTFPKAEELSKKIKEYDEIATKGGYLKVPSVKKSLKKGNYYPQIVDLRQRLIQSKDLKSIECMKKSIEVITEDMIKEVNIHEKNCLELYDENVFNAVKSFQRNHGLVEDGIIGRNTIRRLNIPIEKKIKKMRINLERMRWMPRTLGKKHLIINIPDYKLKMYNNGEVKLNMDVVVGEYKNPTPIFSHKMKSIVLNPYWRIPQSIVKKELIPKLVEDPSYLIKNDIKVFENWDHESMQFDTSSVDWSMYLNNDLIGTSKVAAMRFIQIPGNKNPLGKMKFMFPNRYSVYLHDTPYKYLFKNKRRAFSHGCIRLSRPNDLLKTIMQEDSNLSYKKAEEILSNIEKTDLDLSKKIPVHIIYLTSWIDEEGKIQFRDDIYNYDRMQEKLLYSKATY